MTLLQEIRAMLEDVPVGWESTRNRAGDHIKRVAEDQWLMIPGTMQEMTWSGDIDDALEFYMDLIDPEALTMDELSSVEVEPSAGELYPPSCPAGHDFSGDVRTTIALSVTVKIDAHGKTPDALLSHATMSAMSIIEGALRSKFPEKDGHYVWATFSPGLGDVESTISVEGATAMVNTAELHKLFEA